MWELCIKNMEGTFYVNVEENDDVHKIKQAIADKVGIAVHIQRLLFHNKPLLKDNLTLRDYGAKYVKNKHNKCELQLLFTLSDLHPDIPRYLKCQHPLNLYQKCLSSQSDTKAQKVCGFQHCFISEKHKINITLYRIALF